MKRWIVLAVLAAALLIGGFVYWQSNANLPLDDLVSGAGVTTPLEGATPFGWS